MTPGVSPACAKPVFSRSAVDAEDESNAYGSDNTDNDHSGAISARQEPPDDVPGAEEESKDPRNARNQHYDQGSCELSLNTFKRTVNCIIRKTAEATKEATARVMELEKRLEKTTTALHAEKTSNKALKRRFETYVNRIEKLGVLSHQMVRVQDVLPDNNLQQAINDIQIVKKTGGAVRTSTCNYLYSTKKLREKFKLKSAYEATIKRKVTVKESTELFATALLATAEKGKTASFNMCVAASDELRYLVGAMAFLASA